MICELEKAWVGPTTSRLCWRRNFIPVYDSHKVKNFKYLPNWANTKQTLHLLWRPTRILKFQASSLIQPTPHWSTHLTLTHAHDIIHHNVHLQYFILLIEYFLLPLFFTFLPLYIYPQNKPSIIKSPILFFNSLQR